MKVELNRVKSKIIKKYIYDLEIFMIAEIFNIGASNAAKKVKLKQPDISAWMNGKRNWSYEKIIKIADKLGL